MNEPDFSLRVESEKQLPVCDFVVISTQTAVLTINPPRSWLARRMWRWLGFVWAKS